MPTRKSAKKTKSSEMPEIKSRNNTLGMPKMKDARSIHHVGDSIRFTKIVSEQKLETEDGIEIEKITEIFEETIPSEAIEDSNQIDTSQAKSENKDSEQKFDLELTESEEEKNEMKDQKSTKKKKAKRLGKPTKIISAIFFFIFLIIACIFCLKIFPKGLLPDKYLYPCIAGFSVVSLIFALVTFSNKCKKNIKILCMIFETLISAILIFAITNASNVFDFISAITSGGYQIEQFYVIVKSDSSYESIEDLTSQTVAIYDDSSDSYTYALEQLNSVASLTTASYPNFLDASTALLNGNTESLLLHASFKEIVSDSIPNFSSENIKIIYTIEKKTPLSQTISNVDVKNEAFNVLITGIDTSGDIATVSRSDVNMIATINPKTHKILLTSIPRDYYVQLHGTTGLKDKLTHSGLYGADMTRQTIEDFMNIKIDYYVRVNFDTIINVVDTIGGISINSDTQLYLKANDWSNKYCWYDYGENFVDGDCALRFARERKSYATGDVHRVQNQQEVLSAIINKVSSDKSILMNYENLLNALRGGFQTNMPTEKIYDLTNLQLDEMPSWQIERINLTGFESHEYTYSIPSQLLYVFLEDEESINAATDKIRKTMYPEL